MSAQINYKFKMNESKTQQTYCVEKAFAKGPLHLLYSTKLLQLQNQITFFEGQVDPLYIENISLKEQLVNLSRLVIISTDILRNLLPNGDHPNKKLKLQMANIDEIAVMIKEDWQIMEANLTQKDITIAKLQDQSKSWQDRYTEQNKRRLKQVNTLEYDIKDLRLRMEGKIRDLNQEIVQLITEHNEEKRVMRQEFEQKVISYKEALHQYQLYKKEVRNKNQEYDKCIMRLRGEIQANLESFEESKKNLKGIYEKLMTDKLAEQAEGFELLLKMRQQEKMQIILEKQANQQQHKRRIAQKEYEITKLAEQSSRHAEQINALKGQVWQKQIELDKQREEQKLTREEIKKLNSINTQLHNTLSQQERKYNLEKKQFQTKIKIRQSQLELLKLQGDKALVKMLEEKQALQKTLEEKQKKLRQTLIALRKADDEWTKKIDKLNQQWTKKEQALIQQLLVNRKKLEKTEQELFDTKIEKQDIKKQFTQKIKNIQERHSQQQQYLISKYNKQIHQISEKNQQHLKQVLQEHQRELIQAGIKANDQMREVMLNCNKKLTEQQIKFRGEQAKYKEENQKLAKHISKVQSESRQLAIKIQQQMKKHQQAMQELKQICERQKEMLNQEIYKQMKEFQKSMEEKQALINSMKAELENQIKMLKQAYGIDNIESKYLVQISRLKEQFLQKYKQQQQQNTNCLNEVKSNFNGDLMKIVQKVEQNSAFLNDQLLSSFNDGNLQNLDHNQKKDYIIKKIQDIKQNNKEKDRKIVEMEYALQQAQLSIQRKVKIRKQLLEKQKQAFAIDCKNQIQNLTNQCKAKVTQIQTERIRHTQIIYEEFQKLKEEHQREYGSLVRRYNELQKLFEQRPSRAEDLTKIKELINLQTKLDIQIQNYQKKMETANQIVKYLNLQLENYKDTYDIFGPNGENGIGGIIGQSAIKTNNSISESQLLEILKINKKENEVNFFKEDSKLAVKEPISFRKWNDSPVVKQLKIFQDEESQSSVLLSRDHSEFKDKKERHYSNLILDRSADKKERFKTQKNEKIDNEVQIIINAQNFIRLMKSNKEDPSIIKQVEQQRRKSYRKRRVIKRLPTMGMQQYF